MTASDDLPTFRFALEESTGAIYPAGTAKEATIKQLPISTGLAGVSMRLKPGGLREMHWHAIAAEWAFVVSGRCRTTVIGPNEEAETNDFGPGDVWYFPRGHGHAIQAIGTEECHFILVFDNGAFSEFGTFSSTDWVGHTPPEVLGKTLGLSADELSKLPSKELYILAGRVPPDEPPPTRRPGLKSPANTHRFALMDQEPRGKFPGGVEWHVSAREFPISTTMTGLVLDLEPGAIREPHWHPGANEWQYFISGEASITLFGSGGRARTESFKAGDVGYIPRGYGHYIENTGSEKCRVLIVFDSGLYQEISLSTWLAANPAMMLADNFQVPDELIGTLPTRRVFISPGKLP